MPWGPDYPRAPRPSTGNMCGIACALRGGESENQGPRDRHPQEGIAMHPAEAHSATGKRVQGVRMNTTHTAGGDTQDLAKKMHQNK